MNCIIVDDDILSAKVLSAFASRIGDVDVKNTFQCAKDAIEFLSIDDEKIDIIFLDIEMPEMSGLEFMRVNSRKDAEIIIYSSKEKYAIDSYEYDVCDYLLKPIKYDRLTKAVDRARNNLSRKTTSEGSGTGNDITIKDNSGTICKILHDEITYLQALENYVVVYTETKKYTFHTPLKNLLEQLPKDKIVRVHRSYAVGLAHVKEVKNNSIVLNVCDRTEIPLSKTYRNYIRSFFEHTK